MNAEKLVANRKSFTDFSIYSGFSNYTFRYRNCNLCQIKLQKTPIEKLITGVRCLCLFADFYLDQLFKYVLITNTIPFAFTYWSLCYFVAEHKMSCKQCSFRDEGHNVDRQPPDETQSSDSCSTKNDTSTRTKKSIFATLIKKKHRPRMQITKKVETCSTIRFGTESVSSDQELTRYQPKQQKRGFFKKIIKSSHDKSSGDCDKTALTSSKIIPTSYMPKYNLKLITGMHELQDILHNLHLSEQHVVHLLNKYVVNEDIQKQLLSASFEFFALQYDSKCQVNVLADKMWFQQLELYKMQDYNLQKRLSFLVKTNRALETQIENLSRQCEKLASRSSAYPKRFLHMKSFGKVYAKQLIENNKKLQKKTAALTGIIADFEEELGKLQHQKDVLEQEKRDFRAQIFHLDRELESRESDNRLRRTQLELQVGHQTDVISEAMATVRLIFGDMQDFEYHLAEVSVTVVRPQLQLENPCLPDTIHQLRSWLDQLFRTILTSYRTFSAVAQDVTKLRTTNARLQENLQKSTNELDRLSKKLRSSESAEVAALQTQCRKLEQELVILNQKLQTTVDQNTSLQEEMTIKKKTLSETQTSLNDLAMHNNSMVDQIDELVSSASSNGRSLVNELRSSLDKLDFLKMRFREIVDQQKRLEERCERLDDENQHLLQVQQAYQQDVTTLHDGLSVLSTENENLKKQLATEHQTVLTLQNERLKYLEEKNILKTIFQHLKSEVSRVQQLEGAVADMNKETSRLSLVAEYNKQLGDQLKSEVEMKDNTIMELRQNLEKLSHIQLDSDKEKMTLCAHLSEAVSAKDKLTDCLEVELKKNVRLDESRKKLESSTKSQLKIFEEMQKNERTAMKELLKDFKSLIKQRDCLVLMQEESRKKHKELEKHYHELKKQYEDALAQVSKKEEEGRRMADKVEYQEQQFRQQEENYGSNVARYEKTIRKMEKLLGQMRNEKGELENSNTYLKKNLQKLQSELDETRGKISLVENKVVSKTSEAATLDSELNAYKNELQTLRQDYGKIQLELDYVKKMKEEQASEFKETISSFNDKESMYLEWQNAIRSKEQEINNLTRVVVEKEGEIKRLEQECSHLRRQNDDQTKIMVGYENHLVLLQDAEACKWKIQKELSNVQLEHDNANVELENVKAENEALRNELKAIMSQTEKERAFFKKQTTELIIGYNDQKAGIEDEIDSISSQLKIVTENLRAEKIRFDELANAFDELQAKHVQLKEHLKLEETARKDTERKVEGVESLMNAMATERDNLQRQVHLLLMKINEEQDVSHRLSNENNTIQMILEQGKHQYTAVLNQKAALEDEVNHLRGELEMMASAKEASMGEAEKAMAKVEAKVHELKSAKEIIESLKKELTDSQKSLFELKEDCFKLQQHITALEFKNCELTLQLHESQGKLETERNLFKELKDPKKPVENPTILAPSDCGELYLTFDS